MAIVKSSLEEARRKAAAFDWSRVDATTEEEIAAQVADDAEVPPLMTAEGIADDLQCGEAWLAGPESLDVRGIRTRLGLSQQVFAARFRFPLGSLRNWEQGRRHPDGAARLLLRVIDREPEAVLRALSEDAPRSQP